MDLGNLESLRFSAPELILIATAIVIFAADLVVRPKEHLGSIALFGCAGAQPQQPDLPVEGCRIAEDAAVGGAQLGRLQPGAAESADPGECLQVGQPGMQGLEAAHG